MDRIFRSAEGNAQVWQKNLIRFEINYYILAGSIACHQRQTSGADLINPLFF
jgi:hypothetical protein